MKRIYLTIAILFLLAGATSGQNWMHYRQELWFGTGPTIFLGEVGGRNTVGSDLFWDYDVPTTRFALGGGYRWRGFPRVSFKISAYYAVVSGDDRNTKEPFRQNRNLHFRSPVIELSGQAEYYFIKEHLSHLYRMNRAVRGPGFFNVAAYVFVGVGGFYYQPKAKYQGKWMKLKPLGTEGQGLPGGAPEYSNYTVCIPYGIGVKHILNRHWSIGMEVGIRETFTDYIDDASTVYYDKEAIRAAHGDAAAYLADPSLHLLDEQPPYNDPTFYYHSPTDPGLQRGDPTDNDSYTFVLFSINYRFLRFRRNIPKF